MSSSTLPENTEISVLHVDDDPELAEMVSIYLERREEQLTVQTEQRAQAGLKRLHATPVDCIVSDYQMPGMDGLEFLEAVRTDYPELPFILFTGKGSEEVAAEAINTGVDVYLQKEVGTGQYTVLAQHISTLVEKHRAEQRLAYIVQDTHYSDRDEAISSERDWASIDTHVRAESVSLAVIEMIAEREGIDPVELSPPLYEVLNPEALDALVDPGTGKTDAIDSVTFTYCGYGVTIYNDGQICLAT